MKGSRQEAIRTNNYIQEIKSEIFKIYHHMTSMDQYISADSIKKKFTGEETQRKTLLEAIIIHNEEIKRNIGLNATRKLENSWM